MAWSRKVVLGAALALASTAAFAFQEERQNPGSPQAPAAKAVEAPVALSPSDIAPPSAKGTEVTIPGLGKLGVLPKMNFGLELLYGATEPKKVEEEPQDSDGLTIRGSIKHRF